MYSFYLNETDKRARFCTVPVINIKRVDLFNSHAELQWLLNSCKIDQTSLLFIDEVIWILSYNITFSSHTLLSKKTLSFPLILDISIFYLLFEQVDLSYYDLFGSLKVVLLNTDKLPEKQEVFFGTSIGISYRW